MATQKFTQPAPVQSESACASSVQIERATKFDIYRGTTSALFASGVIEQKHLTPQQGRGKGLFGFMPDGSAVPAGVAIPSSLPGVLWIKICAYGRGEVRLTVSMDERDRRESAFPALKWKDRDLRACYCGSREQLLRDGIPESWIAGLLKPGKKRGRRTFYEGERRIEASQTETGFHVVWTHVEYFRALGVAYYTAMRAEFGLPLVVRGHLSLVWSGPKVAKYACA